MKVTAQQLRVKYLQSKLGFLFVLIFIAWAAVANYYAVRCTDWFCDIQPKYLLQFWPIFPVLWLTYTIKILQKIQLPNFIIWSGVYAICIIVYYFMGYFAQKTWKGNRVKNKIDNL